MSDFNEVLKDLLLEKGYNQTDFANLLNIDLSTVNRYLSGNQMPILEIAIKIADTFNYSMDYLFGKAEINQIKSFHTCPPFSQRFRFLLKHFHKTQINLNEDAKISKSVIYYWLSGKRMPSMDNIIKLSNYFGCSIDFVIGRVDFE